LDFPTLVARENGFQRVSPSQLPQLQKCIALQQISAKDNRVAGDLTLRGDLEVLWIWI